MSWPEFADHLPSDLPTSMFWYILFPLIILASIWAGYPPRKNNNLSQLHHQKPTNWHQKHGWFISEDWSRRLENPLQCLELGAGTALPSLCHCGRIVAGCTPFLHLFFFRSVGWSESNMVSYFEVGEDCQIARFDLYFWRQFQLDPTMHIKTWFPFLEHAKKMQSVIACFSLSILREKRNWSNKKHPKVWAFWAINASWWHSFFLSLAPEEW